MKKQIFSILAVLIPIASVISCKKTSGESLGETIIRVSETPRTDIKLGNLITPTGFTALKPAGACNIRSINKVAFQNDAILVLDTDSDFDNVWIFDNKGNYIRTIGQQEPTEEFGVANMCVWKEETSLLFPSRHAFLAYENTDELPRVLKNGAFGDMIERLDDGGYVLYNEHNPSEVTGNHYILVYDKAGNFLKKEMPYAAVKNAFGYAYTGFMERSGENVWFSPPLSNTVYEVSAQGCSPRYEFDFGSKKIPADLAAGTPQGSEIDAYSFLNEWFVTNSHFVQFEYQSNGRLCHGIFDEQTGQTIELRNIQADCFSRLFSRGTIMPRSADEFVLVLNPDQLQSLLKNDLIYTKELNAAFNGLGDALVSAAKDKHTFLAYFTYQAGAGIPAI